MTISISSDRSKLDLVVIHNFLKTAYWSENIAIDRVCEAIANSLCFGLYEDDRQIGFARVITDYTTIAYLADVFVLETHRDRGLGKQLIQHILDDANLRSVRKWLLATADAHGFYQQFGFEAIEHPELYLEKVNF